MRKISVLSAAALVAVLGLGVSLVRAQQKAPGSTIVVYKSPT